MALKAYQCCYTNASKEIGSKTVSGWQAVAVSPDIPQDAKDTCTGYQSVNSVIQPGATSETGNVLDLFEVFGDGKYIYSMRSRYGLVDRLGRPNMFSHAYIMPCEDVIEDPNWFLSIPDNNYSTDETEASWDGSIAYGEPMTIDTAMKAASLTEDRLALLAMAAYAQMSDRKKTKPLYLQSDGNLTTVKATLFCLYSSLPFYLRRHLKAASEPSNGDDKKNIVFSMHAQEKELFFVPETGENTILTTRIEKKISRYGFLTYPFKNLSPAEYLPFFHKLDEDSQKLISLGRINDLTTRIAFTFQQDPTCKDISDQALEDTLIDLLQTEPTDNQTVGTYIATIVREADKREVEISEETEAMLSDWINASNSEILFEMKANRGLARLCAKSPENASQLLQGYSDKERTEYLTKLQETEKGLEITKQYFLDICKPDKAKSWIDVKAAIQEYEAVQPKEELATIIASAADRVYRISLTNLDDAPNNLHAYRELISRILTESEAQERVQTAKNTFWKAIDADSISYKDENLITALAVPQGSPNEEKYKAAKKYISLVKSYRPDGEVAFFEELRAFCASNELLYKRGFAPILQDMQEYVLSCYGTEKGKNFAFWADKIIRASTEEIAEEYLLLKHSFEEKNTEAMTSLCIRLIKKDNVSEQDKADISNAVLKTCENLDSLENPIPLDCWIAISKALGNKNCFDIFTDFTPKIFFVDPQRVVSESTLLNNNYPKADVIARDAIQYINTGTGNNSKEIMAWLKLAQLSGTEEFLAAMESEEKNRAEKDGKNPPKPGVESVTDKTSGRGLFKNLFRRGKG